MKVIEHLEKAKNPLFSYEIVPPPRGRTVQDIIDIVKALVPYNPPWIDVTAHSATAFYNEHNDGSIERRVLKKRPGTIGICGIIQNRFKIDTVTHLLCRGFTKEETEDALLELGFLGIHNILALRGDGLNYKKAISKDRTTNEYAVDLVHQLKNVNNGEFLDKIPNAGDFNFGIGVASYPEKHFEAPNLKQDVAYLKEKFEAGAEYSVTQMFFDNSHYFNFVEKCKEAGIYKPIIPGLKIIKSASQLKNIPRNFYVNFPDGLVDEMMANQNHIKEIGIRHAKNQTRELLEKGVPCVHFYIMNDTDNVLEVVKEFA